MINYLAIRNEDLPIDPAILRTAGTCSSCAARCLPVSATADPAADTLVCNRCFGIAPAEFEKHVQTMRSKTP